MAEETREPWLNQMALTTVVLAVCATLSTFKGGSYSTLSVISQAQSSDQWAFYQAKSTKQHLYELQVDQLQLQALALAPGHPAHAAFDAKIADYQRQIARYNGEKKELQDQAKGLEQQRDEAKARGKPFGLAVIFLQVAILLNSISGLLKARRVWWTAIPVALVGVAMFANGLLSLF